MHKRQSMVWIMVGMAVFAIGCSSGSSDVVAADEPVVVALPAEVVALGDLARSTGQPIVRTFDTQAGSIEIGGGASLVVPAGAFAAPTEVTIERLDLAFAEYLSSAPTGAVYVVSTVEEVALDTPVLLLLERPASEVNVVQYRDGAWKHIVVEPGDTTVVPIEHFSSVPTMVVDRLDANAAAVSQAAPDSTDAGFLTACVVAVSGTFGGLIEPSGVGYTEEEERQIRLANNLALSVCTNALVDRATPDGRRVSTACVGDKIDDDTNFRGAIAECLADQDAAATEPSEQPEEEVALSDAAAESSSEQAGPASFVGSASTGAIETGPDDDLFVVDYEATIDAGMAVIEATVEMHFWTRGGPDENFPDQNCGVLYRYQMRFEGASGNPTQLRGVSVGTEVLDVHGALCDDGSADFWQLEVGQATGSFQGKANGSGIEGTLRLNFRDVELSAS